MSRHGALGRELSPLLPSAIDRSSVLSELGFNLIKLHLVLTVAVTSFVTFELFVSKMHNLGLGGGLHFGRLLSTHFLEAQGPNKNLSETRGHLTYWQHVSPPTLHLPPPVQA